MKCERHSIKQTSHPTFSCDACAKKYYHRQSLRTHKISCSIVPVMLETNPSTQNDTRSDQEIIHQQQMEKLKHDFEKEQQEMKITFEKTMKTQIDKIHILETHIRTISSSIGNTPTITQVPMKRRKINKALKQQIVNEQNNACGECKLALTPYYQLDHMIGLQFGGTDDRSNLMALCCECHAKKSIGENKCRKRIQDAIQDILRETER